MARGGTKFPLIVYKHLLNRWWTPMIAMGLGMFGIAYGQYMEPLGPFLPMSWMPLVVIGVLAIMIGIFFLIIRQIA
jgi:uncharacterized membrane protein (DUF106 family)